MYLRLYTSCQKLSFVIKRSYTKPLTKKIIFISCEHEPIWHYLQLEVVPLIAYEKKQRLLFRDISHLHRFSNALHRFLLGMRTGPL